MIYNVVQPPRTNSAQMAGDERYDLWRKQGFICRPFSSEIKDGTRFLDDYLEQAQKLEADDDWMEDDVLLGKDQGGDDAAAPPMPVAGAPGHAAAVAARRKRLKKAPRVLGRLLRQRVVRRVCDHVHERPDRVGLAQDQGAGD